MLVHTLDSLAVRRPWPVAALLGLAALMLASLAVTPARAPLGELGAAYCELAASPLGEAPNPVPGRLLTPLVSWLVGLRGERMLATVLAACLLLPVLVARHALARGLGVVGAGLFAAALATTLVVRTSLHCGCYPDVVTYLGLFGVWVLRRRPGLAALCWFLALLDHERAVLMGPWVVALLVHAGGRSPGGRRVWAWLAPLLAVAAWFALHAWLESRRPAEHSVASYLQPLLADPLHNLRPYGIRPLIGWASALQWIWLVPLAWSVTLVRHRRWGPLVIEVGLPLAGAGVAMLVAYDWSRMAVLAFPCLLPALEAGLAGGGAYRRRLGWLLAAQTVTPQVFTAWYIVEIMRSWSWPW